MDGKKELQKKTSDKKTGLGLNACVEDIEYSSNRSMDKQLVNGLSSCGFIEKSLNIIITER